MSEIQERLFDVTPYGGAEPTKKELPKERQRAEPFVEPWQDPWILIRNRQGVAPFSHLEVARNDHGAVTTVCGLIGTKIPHDTSSDPDYMIRCIECDTGAQLK